MAIPNTAFPAIMRHMQATMQSPVYQWTQDSLALGPHAMWVEPSEFKRAWSAEEPWSDEELYIAIRRMPRSTPNDTLKFAAYLQGVVPTARTTLTDDQITRVLEPLWARSAMMIHGRLAGSSYSLLQYVCVDAAPGLVAQEITCAVDYKAADIDGMSLRRWQKGERGEVTSPREAEVFLQAFRAEYVDELTEVLVAVVNRIFL